MICPRCSAQVRVFSAEWQGQKALPSRHCPVCKGTVELVFDGRRVGAWWMAIAALISVFATALGMPWPLALFLGLMFGAVASMFPSMVLAIPLVEGKGVRAALYKSIELPAWAKPRWLLAVGRVLGLVIGVLFVVGLALSYLSWPWSGIVLSVGGAIGVWKRTFVAPWSQLVGPLPQAASGVLLAIGVGLLLYGVA